jgi:Cd2+/Zn2+-exporting ATPase
MGQTQTQMLMSTDHKHHSRHTHALLVQNIVLALGIKAAFLVLTPTLTGLGTMWMAVFADVGASLLVVGNGLRLLRVNSSR